MSPEISLMLFVLNLPVFIHIHRRFFADASAWKAALDWEYDPQYTAMIMEGQWASLLKANPLGGFSLVCGAVLFCEFLVLQLAFGLMRM